MITVSGTNSPSKKLLSSKNTSKLRKSKGGSENVPNYSDDDYLTIDDSMINENTNICLPNSNIHQVNKPSEINIPFKVVQIEYRDLTYRDKKQISHDSELNETFESRLSNRCSNDTLLEFGSKIAEIDLPERLKKNRSYSALISKSDNELQKGKTR